MDALKERINKLQTEIEENRGLLNQEEEEGLLSRHELKELIETKRKQLAELQSEMENTEEVKTLCHSTRQSVPTEKFLAYQNEEQSKRRKRLLSLYEQWRLQIRTTRENLKKNTSDMELAKMADNIENGKDDIMKAYNEIRQGATPSTDLRRKIDACEAVTRDIMKIINERLSGVDGDFDEEHERQKLRELRAHDYAHSIYGSSSQSTNSHSTNSHSFESVMAAKRAEAAAELAAKETQCKLMEEERKQKEKIRMMESELERLQAERDMQVARVRLESYDREIRQETDNQSLQQFDSQYIRQDPSVPVAHLQGPSVAPPNPSSGISSLAQAIQDSIAINRLPMPTPTVFGGDPIHYIEWRASFMSLIDKRGISSSDKLYYLKKYVSGPAHKCIEGTFYRDDDEAYRDAWNKLNQRFGQPFVIQRAFREKLSKWPKVQNKDAEGLRAFSDFLNACLQAMPHVKGLEILNDCEENQKLTQKVPDWLAARWNRQVSIALMEGGNFPTFEDFSTFVSVEAEIACNPITSLHALHSSGSSYVKRSTNETKGNRVSVFSTQTNANTESLRSNVGKEKPPCMYCKDVKHQLPMCTSFKEKSLEERREFIKDNKLCYGCVKPGHSAKECRHRHTCELCKGRHPTCLHDENYKRHGEKDRPAVMEKRKSTTTTNTASDGANEIVNVSPLCVIKEDQSCSTSMIVPVWVSSTARPSKEQLVYALLDTQSDSTFIEKEVSEELQPNTFPVQLKLTTMLGDSMIMKSERIEGLRVRGYSSGVYIDLPPSYTKDCIPMNREHIPTHQTAKQWPHLAAIADQMPPLLSCDVGLLIGYNCPRALKPRQMIDGMDDEPYAVLTDLGWSIVGSPKSSFNENQSSLCHRVTLKELPSLTPMDVISVLESDFKDTKGDDKTVSQEDLKFLSRLKESIKKNAQGHYEMPLPFKERPSLPDNKRLAEIRLDHLRRKFIKDEKYKRDYTTYMNEIISRGDVEEVPTDGVEGERWYIPHHGIYHPQKPDKLRVVFDCSAKHRGTSLNEHLLPGPDMINNLTGILIRFRQHPIALLCDIEKMFHQFHVQEEDRDYLRFLWWNDGDCNTKPREYRMKVHLFGAVSSPGCANYGLKHLAKEHSHSHPAGAQFVAKDFYVDDGVTSTDSVEKAIQLAKEAREICLNGGLRLHKFVSNNHAVMQSLPPSECAVEVNTRDLTFNDTLERALGIQWSIKEDTFRFNSTLKDQPATRRGILSTVASIYDPLGFLAPYVLNGKRILQEMCNQGSGWDEPLPERLKPRWENWKHDFSNLQEVKISRCYVPANFGKVVESEVHHFSDASTSGYGQCSYLRVKNTKGEVHCSLLIGKARVSPTKVTTIPRLELTAAVISVSISHILREELRITEVNEYFWTDSKVVLGYINNDARRFHTFVANRVQKIRHSTTPQQWRYVPTDENPADGASRGKTVKELLASNWFTGPTFLWQKELPTLDDAVPDLSIGDPEVRKAHTLQTRTTEIKSLVDRLSKFSSWSRATRAVARLLRRAKGITSHTLSSVSERERAEHIIIKDLQRQTYEEEIKLSSKGNQLQRHNKLHHLDVFLDADGLLKVGGRLRHSSLTDSFKHPIIIPKEHHVTKLIIAHNHEKTKHQGKGFTINEIRASGYWIPGMSRAVASYIHQCVSCRKFRRAAECQRMSDLPVERVEPSPPFTYCGMDCFGPFITTQGRKQYKRYGLLFTCFCSRAIHIEMLEDLSTDTFINALRCFIALRGAVRQIQCDQGTNFVGAKNEFKAALQELDTQRLNTFLSQKQCDFIMNAPHASHTGGVWERQIKTVRSVLSFTLSLAQGRLSDASLRTVLYEAMAIVNSRPLTVDNLNHPDSLEPLTPNHLINMKSCSALPPPGTFPKEDLYGVKRWRRVQHLAEQFWSRWKREYLHNISTRQRWHTPRRNLMVGDIVMDKDELLPRGEWRLARVIETVSGKDGLVRRVKISVGDKSLSKKGERLVKPSILERPVQKVVLLLEAS